MLYIYIYKYVYTYVFTVSVDLPKNGDNCIQRNDFTAEVDDEVLAKLMPRHSLQISPISYPDISVP